MWCRGTGSCHRCVQNDLLGSRRWWLGRGKVWTNARGGSAVAFNQSLCSMIFDLNLGDRPGSALDIGVYNCALNTTACLHAAWKLGFRVKIPTEGIWRSWTIVNLTGKRINVKTPLCALLYIYFYLLECVCFMTAA